MSWKCPEKYIKAYIFFFLFIKQWIEFKFENVKYIFRTFQVNFPDISVTLLLWCLQLLRYTTTSGHIIMGVFGILPNSPLGHQSCDHCPRVIHGGILSELLTSGEISYQSSHNQIKGLLITSMRTFYRGPSIDASYQVSVHLAEASEGFQRSSKN
jgi:hypothetical protein